MSGLVQFTQFQAEALLICLAGSFAWAGFLLFCARGLERNSPATSAETLWITALLFAVLPSLTAPMLAAFGISLRPSPAPLEFPLHDVAAAATPVATELAAPERSSSISPDQIVGAAALIYIYGVFLTFFLWAVRHAGLKFAVAQAECAKGGRLLDLIDAWSERLGVPVPDVRLSRHVSSVCITGVFRQTILIPRGIETRISTDDLALMCAHELAHVRRGDTRLFTATQLARVLFWFNPMISRIASRVELAAEENADALVIRAGVDRRTYAACFVEGLKFAAYKMNAALAPAPSFTPADRFGRRRRLNSILSIDANHKTPFGKRLLLSAAASTMALAAFGQAALAVDPESAAERRGALRNLPLIGDVTLGYEAKTPAEIDTNRPKHQGLDIKAPKGARISAPGDGIVLEATDLYNGSPAWGKVVVIDHGHGLVTRYAHLDSYAVKKGQRVRAGEIIAAVGATVKTTGPHLHFETLQDGEPVNPASIVAKPVIAPREAAPAIHPAPAPAATEPAKPALPAELAQLMDILGVPGVQQFSTAKALTEFDFPDPVIVGEIAAEDISAPDELLSDFAIADGASTGLLIDDVEDRLLGALDGENLGAFNFTFRNGDDVVQFSSAEPMTARDREKMRAALKDARAQMESARKDAAKRQEDRRKEFARERIEAEHEALRASAERQRQNDEDMAMFRAESLVSRREMLTIQREALEDARDDMDGAAEEAVEEALADLEDFEAEIEEAGFSREKKSAMLADIRQQRRDLERNAENHKRLVEETKGRIERQIDVISRQLDALESQHGAR